MNRFTKVAGKKFYDIAANLADGMFQGMYYGKANHPSDLDQVIKRAADQGVDRLLIVGGYIEDTLHSEEICKKSDKFYTTVGVHPCRANVVFKLIAGGFQKRRNH